MPQGGSGHGRNQFAYGSENVTTAVFADHSARHENGGADEISVAGLSGLLADAQTPLAHKTSHENGGADEISVAGLSGVLADPQTPAAHTHTFDSLTGVDDLPADASKFLDGTGVFSTPVSAAGDFDNVLTANSTIAANKTRTIGHRLTINDTIRLTVAGRLVLV